MIRTFMLAARSPAGELVGTGFARINDRDMLVEVIPWHERDDFSEPWCSGDLRILRGTE